MKRVFETAQNVRR